MVSLSDFDEFDLGGSGLGTVVDRPAPSRRRLLADGKTVRYAITGAFNAAGEILVDLQARDLDHLRSPAAVARARRPPT